ncbi:sugar ABC transporter substrate-binding protein [Metallibacterium scheffleri]
MPAMKRALHLLWLLPVLLAATLTGCTRTPQDSRIVLRFWAMGEEGQAAARLVKGFETLHPDIRVEVQQLPWTAAHAKLLTAYAGGTTPDIAQMGNTWIPEMAALRAIVPLDRFIAGSHIVTPADYFPGIWKSNVIAGKDYGVPWYVDTRLIFYRKDILAAAGFDHPPTSWAGWTRMMAAIKARARPGDWAALLPLNEFEQLVSFSLEQPGSFLKGHDQYGNFQSPQFTAALRFYLDFFRAGYAPRIDDTQIASVPIEFARGHYAFYISGPWMIREFATRMPAAVQKDWATAPLPGPTGADSNSGIAGGASLVIFRSSRHKAAAWKLIEYLSRPAVQDQFHRLTSDLPPRRSTFARPDIASDPYAAAFFAQLQRARAVPRIAEYEQIVREMQTIAARAAWGRLDVAQTTALLDRKTDAILAKRRWMIAHGRLAP